MDVGGYPSRGSVAAFGLVTSVMAFALFVAARRGGDWMSALAGPICLWWVALGLSLLLSVAFSKPGKWPRDRRSRYIAGLAALVVGLWISCAGLWSLALTVLPVYCVGERWVYSRAFPPDTTGVYAPMPVWMMYILLGELLGFAVGSCLRAFAR
jgi:hypothetical protein